jgi:2-hydroxychromene-2-carboxylate isomerase
VRIVAPMPKHEHGRDAARAYLAAWAQGKGDEMAELLFAAREQDLTPEGCEGLAESLGLSLSSYRSCVAAPETDSEIDANLEWVKSACPQGLPCIWMQDQRLLGLRGSMMLRDAFLAAERRPGAPAR